MMCFTRFFVVFANTIVKTLQKHSTVTGYKKIRKIRYRNVLKIPMINTNK